MSMIDSIVFYALSSLFQPYNDGDYKYELYLGFFHYNHNNRLSKQDICSIAYRTDPGMFISRKFDIFYRKSHDIFFGMWTGLW